MTDSIHIVEAYFRRECPAASLMHGRDSERSGHTFSLREAGEIRLLTLSREFFDDYPGEQIEQRLTEWRVAEALRTVPAGHRVIVTTAGIRTEDR